ncbi:MAG: histidinol dehydrogenase, partial [Opitutae bacterium]|nr:histidinol dehydrogenase [Opitutae bacterium]
MQYLDGEDSELFEKLGAISSDSRNPEVESFVTSILKKVSDEGDAGLLSFTSQFDRVSLTSAEQCVTASEFNVAEEALQLPDRTAIEEAIQNVRAFHSHCPSEDWMYTNSHGGSVGERYYPLRRVGIYVPGGQVPLVSTVIMTTVLANAAGVPEIAVTTPPRPDGTIAPALLAALSLCGVDEVYKAGGAQAVAALAYGTETIAPVDKIFGPGNAYVNEAKRQVFGTVGIDLLPGPSEVMVIADDTARPAYVAAALLAQAEHGSGKENVFLLCMDENILQLSLAEIEKQLETLSHRDAIRRVLKTGLFVIRISSENQAFEVANFIAPEHLELQIDDSKVERFTSSITT